MSAHVHLIPNWTDIEEALHCGCWWEWGQNHKSPEGCDAFQFGLEVEESFRQVICICCRRFFLVSDVMVDEGDSSVGMWGYEICWWCESEECECGEGER